MQNLIQNKTIDLSNFRGSENFYEHNLLNISCIMTEGIKYLADEANAYWLLDAILSHQTNTLVRKEEFQVWSLKKDIGEKWILSCEDGNKHEIVIQRIPYSDFPIDEITIWFTNGTLLLPSEY